MRKTVISLLILLFSCHLLQGRIRFGLAVLGCPGFSYFNNYNRIAEDSTEYWVESQNYWGVDADYYVVEEDKKSGFFTGELEARIKIQEDLLFAFGFGSMTLPLGNPSAVFTPDPSKNSLLIESGGKAHTFSFTEYYVLPVGNRFELYFGFTGEYCRATVDYGYSWSMGGMGEDIQGTFKAGSIGFGGKLFLEYKTFGNIRLLTGLYTKYMSIDGFTGTVKNNKTGEESEQTLYRTESGQDDNDYEMWQPGKSPEDIMAGDNSIHDVREMSLNLSGMNICFGIGYYF